MNDHYSEMNPPTMQEITDILLVDLKAEYKDRYSSDELKAVVHAVVGQFKGSIGSMTGWLMFARRNMLNGCKVLLQDSHTFTSVSL